MSINTHTRQDYVKQRASFGKYTLDETPFLEGFHRVRSRHVEGRIDLK